MEESEYSKAQDKPESLYIAHDIVDQIVKNGGMNLYDKYLTTILPNHEIGVVVGSVKHVIHSHFPERDYGEHWSDEMDEEAEAPIICKWANGSLPIETKVVFNYEEEDNNDSLRKTVTKSVTSYLRKKGKALSHKKLFKEFAPKPEPVKDPEKVHPKIIKAREKEKSIEVINPAFPHLDMEENIDRLRRKVDIEDKRRRIEEEIRIKKRKANRANVAGGSTIVGNKPFTTNDDGHPILIKNVNTYNLPNHESNHTTEINVDHKKVYSDKIENLRHLYSVPAGANVQLPYFDKAQNLNEDNHVQEITALQPPPSEVLTLKAGVILNENGHEVKGPEADHKNRMTKDEYQSKLGSQSMQRKKFHEQRIKQNSRLDTSYNTQNNLSISKLSAKQISASKFSKKKAHQSILKSRIANNFSNSSFYKSDHGDQILINQNTDIDWKGEMIEPFKNPKKSDSKYSAALLNDSYISSNQKPRFN